MTTPKMIVAGPTGDRFDEILTPEALEFLAELHEIVGGRRAELLHARKERVATINNGRDLHFLPETQSIRDNPKWQVAGAGPGLHDRRVEITGPTDRKMTVNAMNSGAKVWLADGEDASSPTWANVIGGQVNLYDAIRRQIDFTSPEGKEYKLGEETPTIVFRPRGWHLVEKHLRHIDALGEEHSASGSLVDFGLYFFHNAKTLIETGTGPYFYLPKLEGHREARLWNDVFDFAEAYVEIDHGTIRATVLIETFPAAFEMDEILYELREHCAGLNAGRWDYIFSLIKNYRERGPRYVLPDRSQVTMTVPFMRAYTELLVSTCHRRGAHAIGGMSAFIPNRRDPEVTEKAFAQVAADKAREANDGFDGSWVAHPDLVPIAMKEFDDVLGFTENQVETRRREDVQVTAAQLLNLEVPGGTVTDAGVRQNISVGLRYIASWLRGTGAAALDNLMEDAATAEISRSQLWQWIRQGTTTAEGHAVTREYVGRLIDETVESFPREDGDMLDEATSILADVALGEQFPTFLTIPAYCNYLSKDVELAQV